MLRHNWFILAILVMVTTIACLDRPRVDSSKVTISATDIAPMLVCDYISTGEMLAALMPSEKIEYISPLNHESRTESVIVQPTTWPSNKDIFSINYKYNYFAKISVIMKV